MKNRIFSLLICLLLLCSMGMPAYAHEVPDMDEKGTITLYVDWAGEPIDGGSLSLYRVGDIAENDGNFSFEPIAELEGYGLSLDKVDDPALARKLAQLAKDGALTEISAPIKDGEAFFSNVVPGLYVVVQAEDDASSGFAAMSPFLISMPKYENGHYVTNVTADPKVPLETVPQETTEPKPTQPPDPTLPQTGQLNWPVPILAVMGLSLFALGWGLCFGRRREK